MRGGEGMSLKYAKLRGRIVEKFGTQDAFREQIGISKTAMSNKMTGKTGFSQNDIIKWCELLSIDMQNVSEYFFAKESN